MRETSSSVFEFLARDVSKAGSFHSRKSGVAAIDGDVLQAVDAGGRPAMLVPIGNLKDGPADWQSKSLSLQAVDLSIDNAQRPYVILRCLDPKLHHQFGLLADDVLDAIERDPGRAPNAVSATLDRWRNLFEAEHRALLGAAQLAGIFAELLVLHQLVSSHGPKALSAWKGPEGSRHDFVFAGCSVEVKATTNHNNMVVTIHGGRQLSAPGRGDLYLHAFQLESSPNGTSVPNKIRELVLLGVSRLELLTALSGAHYSDADASAYNGIKFMPLSEKTYLVDESFPRITAETLFPAGTIDRLGNIAYSIDLGQLVSIDFDLDTVELASDGAA